MRVKVYECKRDRHYCYYLNKEDKIIYFKSMKMEDIAFIKNRILYLNIDNNYKQAKRELKNDFKEFYDKLSEYMNLGGLI